MAHRGVCTDGKLGPAIVPASTAMSRAARMVRSRVELRDVGYELGVASRRFQRESGDLC